MKDWKVTAFNDWTLVGWVTKVAEDGSICTMRFHSTSFQSDTSLRWPRVGEVVEVMFNNSGELLSVHGK